MKQSLKDDYRRSLKSMDTEEGIDLAFYRPIGYMWARLAAHSGVSPNAITIAAIFSRHRCRCALLFPGPMDQRGRNAAARMGQLL